MNKQQNMSEDLDDHYRRAKKYAKDKGDSSSKISTTSSDEDTECSSSDEEQRRRKKRSSRHEHGHGKHDRSKKRDREYYDHDRKKKRDHKKKKHRHQSSSSSSSSSSSRSSSSSSSSSHERDRHHKRRRKVKDKKTKRKQDGKKHNSSRDHEMQKDKIKDDQPIFGKYGVVKESDFRNSTKVRRSFEVWMEEIKGIPQGSNVPKNELATLFKDYAEDFNTATLPHIKFYDYDKWEAEEYQRRKNDVIKEGTSFAKSDEFFHREELQKKEEEKRRKEMDLIRSGMTREKVEEMKHQARLKAEMVNAYKTGDEEKRKRLQKRLEPEDDPSKW